jgi:hypothetical protein
MPTTSNFGWTTPADTDLVKDGAAAIRTLGNGIDTSFLDLKGGTTDQVLAKNSNTDLDFKWVTSDDANAIQNAIVDAKGDLISATAADTPARLAVGANGTVLTADSAEATGLKWAASSGFTFAAYTPSYTNITIGNGTVVARYGQSGKFVLVNWDWIWGSTSSISGSQPKVSLPVTAANTSGLGTAYFLDAGTLEQFGAVVIKSTGDFQMILPQNGTYGAGEPTATFPWTWTTSDRIKVSICYEAA